MVDAFNVHLIAGSNLHLNDGDRFLFNNVVLNLHNGYNSSAGKNVLQFLLIFAHNLIEFNLVSR